MKYKNETCQMLYMTRKNMIKIYQHRYQHDNNDISPSLCIILIAIKNHFCIILIVIKNNFYTILIDIKDHFYIILIVIGNHFSKFDT